MDAGEPMKGDMILTVDIGSTGVRAVLVNTEGRIVYDDYRRIGQYFPRQDWIEHDLDNIWTQCLAVCRGVLETSGIDIKHIKGMGVVTQRNTLAVWNTETGAPLFRAISWADNRTRDLCIKYRERDQSNAFLRLAGRRLSTTNIGLKLRWVMEENQALENALLSNTALWGTLDTWLVWKLTSGRTWATDYANAATTGIFDLIYTNWSSELMDLLDLPKMPFPDVRPTIGNYGEASVELLGGKIRIASVSGDQFAALFGQGCIHSGMAKCTLGTGGFFLINMGSRPKKTMEGLTTRICWHLGDYPVYALEGMAFHVGTLIDWICTRLGLVKSVEESAEIAVRTESRGTYMVPAFSGLGAPYWDPGAKAILVGFSLDTGPEELIRAGLEAVAFQIQDMVEIIKKRLPSKELRLRVDGNVARNDTLMQILADQLQILVERPSDFGDRTALGAAYLAGIHLGIWQRPEETQKLWRSECIFYPQKPSSETQALYQGWQEAVRRSRGIAIQE